VPRYAASAVPWFRVVLAACLVLVLMDVVGRWPWHMWPLQGVAVGLLAGAAAWCFDEESAAVVDVAPRGLAWQALGRSAGLLILVAAWGGAVVRTHASLFGHPRLVALQGLVAVLAGAAWAAWGRARGQSTPGLRASFVVIPGATAWALVRPFAAGLPVFPYTADGRYGDWAASGVLWGVVGVVSMGLLVAALGEAPWWRLGRSTGRRAETQLT
jgi:hypothetical protein